MKLVYVFKFWTLLSLEKSGQSTHQVKNLVHNWLIIEHFTVVCLVAWPLNENEAGGDQNLIDFFKM